MKYIVINGKKFKIDPTDESKALLDDKGEPIPYEEETDPNEPKPGSHEFKMKNDPEYARIFLRNQELEDEARKKAEKDEEERQENLRKNGEFQKLAEENGEKARVLSGKLTETNAILDKYKGTLEEIRDEMLEQIPEDKRSLVPNDSAKNQIDYIRKNAQFLGVSLIPTKKGSDVPPNKDTPPLDEEGKLQKEYNEIMAKDNLTRTEQNRLTELAKLLKQIRSRKA